MRKKNAVLAIDFQRDFTQPSGSLFVPGAVEDCKRFAGWIEKNQNEIDHVSATLDSHHTLDISHPFMWQDKDGKNPPPFTIITSKDVKEGKWSARFFPIQVLKYLEDLEGQGEYAHCVWPEHCLISSEMAAIDPIVLKAIQSWDRNSGKFQLNFCVKGVNFLTENFGIFSAQVPIANDSSTQLNQNLIKILSEYQNVYLCGEAKNFCIAVSMKQAMKFCPELAKRFIVLQDCMSDVPGFKDIDKQIWEDAKNLGVRFSTTTADLL